MISIQYIVGVVFYLRVFICREIGLYFLYIYNIFGIVLLGSCEAN